MVDSGGLENRCTFTGTGGSNPSASAEKLVSLIPAFFFLDFLKRMRMCMDQDVAANIQMFQVLAHSASMEKRIQAVERLDALPDDEHFSCAVILLNSPYHDLWEAALETCSSERVSSDAWRGSLDKYLDKNLDEIPAKVQQALVICIRRMDGDLSNRIKTFCQKCLESDDLDVRYQAFCLAEIQEECSEAYSEFVRKALESKDSDFRIIAIQAIQRLRPDWGLDALRKRSIIAYGEEAFHLVLAQMSFDLDDELRSQLETQLITAISDSRYAFPAIQAVVRYHVEDAVPALLRQAKSFFTEPTIRVASAGAAAKLGSAEGRKLLVKFATSDHGNPDYANELLESLKKKEVGESKASE